MFLVRKFKNIIWEHVEFDEGKSQFLLFLVVYHILSETEIWSFLWLLRMNSSEMQYRDQLNWTKELNRGSTPNYWYDDKKDLIWWPIP